MNQFFFRRIIITAALCIVSLLSSCTPSAPRKVNIASDAAKSAIINCNVESGDSIIFANNKKLVAPFKSPVSQVTVDSGMTFLRTRWMETTSTGGFLAPTYTSSRFQCFDIKFQAKAGHQYQLQHMLDGSRVAMWVEDLNGSHIMAYGEVSDTSFCEMPVLMSHP